MKKALLPGGKGMNGKKERALRVQVLAVALALGFTATELLGAVSGVTFPQPHSTVFMSRDQDVELGKQAAQQARQQMPVVSDNDPLAQYVRTLGMKLAPYVPESADAPRFPYEFHVVSQKDINA